ncbi:MAG TPA: DUF4432 family protein [Bryobacteraceae bacterium]|nr:DUF4432 family protein [Bryobacteraceae bacterium]
MAEVKYRNRRAFQIENRQVRVTVMAEGGHIAELFHKETGVNPLWTPPWNTIEPSTYDRARHPEYGSDAESKLLSGIMGHNLALGLFGPPSEQEAAAGMTVHGEASVLPYEITTTPDELVARLTMPKTQLKLERRIRLSGSSPVVRITESVENLSALDFPAAWTQHVTLGPPFLERGSTQFRAPGTRSKTSEGKEFDWPLRPREHGAPEDLRVYTDKPVSSGFTTHLMDPHHERAFFLAWSPRSHLLMGYIWKRADFPWLGIWEENHSRTNPPWNGRTMTRGMEFGASPFPETRRMMIERNGMYGVSGYRWLPARTTVRVDYCAFVMTAPKIPESMEWDSEWGVKPGD